MGSGKATWLAAAMAVLAGMAAWAGPTAGWERDMAGDLRPEMPGERTRTAWRSARRMAERPANAVRAECAGVANGALAASGAEFPADAAWRTAYASPEERVEVAEFRDGAGRANRMAVYEQLEKQVPYYWTVEGGTAAEVLAKAKDAWEVDGVLDRSDIRMDELGDEVVPPYERFRFHFLDDAPGQDWIRPCRYVFEDADGSGTTVLWRKLPPRLENRATGEEIPWAGERDQTLEDGDQRLQAATEEVRAWRRELLKDGPAEGAFAANGASAGNAYFVLFSGGVSREENSIRFWCDTAMLYSTLRLKYGVPKERIHAFVSDGRDAGADADLGREGAHVFVNSPQDLDGDGVGDIDGAATAAELSGCLEALSRILGPEDQLWVFVTSHGASVGMASAINKEACAFGWAGKGAEYDTFTDAEFARWIEGFRCPVAVALEPCFSGGFVDDLIVQENRAIATAASYHEASFGMCGGGCWGDAVPAAGKKGTPGKTPAANSWAKEFVSALRGVRPANLDYVAFPWQDGTQRVDADTDGDGRVSFREAAEWAQANDTASCQRQTHAWTGETPCLRACNSYQNNEVEHPQYAESSTGLGASMFAAPRVWGGEANGSGDVPSPPSPFKLPVPRSAYKQP